MQSQAKAWFAENEIVDGATKHPLAAIGDDEHRTLPDATYKEPLAAHRTILQSPAPSAPQPLADPLTNRELDVLDLLDQRLSNKEIAAKLFISTTTVKGHLQNIYGKLNVKKRHDAVEKAKGIGIL